MSVRGTKRSMRAEDQPSTSSKKRRTEPEDALWQLRPVSDLKMSSIYNRSASEAPAELFRKDLISAMKLPDSEPLTSSDYWVITDTWKQDWERGVQVPVNPESLPAPKVKIIENPLPPNFQEFKLNKDKYIHLNRDSHYKPDEHQLSTVPAKVETYCTYDLDATDLAWLKLLNAERARAGAGPINEDQLERVIEELELRCWDKIQSILKSEEGLGIEYDENVICDVCRSPDSEEGNEMVFCDSCNICVHQACYGITTIPSAFGKIKNRSVLGNGQWLCRPCGDPSVRPTCVLCPNLGGAMKCTPSGHKWAHVSCVLWIPEVSIGCPEKMEPITKISAIPASRWSLVCVLCRERKGACIQCSVKTCKTAYHVTCAFKHGLEMRAIIEDENADDGVKLRSYCQKHSVNSKKDKCGSGSEEDEVKRKRRKDMTSEEKSQARAARLQEIEAEFDRHVNVKDISANILDIDQDAITYIYNYWKLKRRSGRNRPLLPPKSDDTDIISHRQEQADLDKMKMFVQLRQDLERVRNLCYMVSRREKLSRSFFRLREQTFHKQIALLSSGELSESARNAVIEGNHGPSIYDRLYSHANAADHKHDFDQLLARIAGVEATDDKKKDLNGIIKSNKSSSNPYKKHYVNGSTRRSGSIYSGMSSEESAPEIQRTTSKHRNRTIGSSTDDEKPSTSMAKKRGPKHKGIGKKTVGRKKRTPQSKTQIASSSEDEHPTAKKHKSRSATLRQMAKEMAAVQTGSDSDDIITMRTNRTSKFPVDIYSDSSEDAADKNVKTEKSPANDSQQPLPRTKAAMKEFIPIKKLSKEASLPKKRGRKPSSSKEKVVEKAKNKENVKFSKSKDPTDLIVPQRQAAKKASENMRSTGKVKDSTETVTDKTPPAVEESRIKGKGKGKGKEIKESPTKDSSIKKKRSSGSTDLDKETTETIAYVPQRQAAKKAAAHIKSGLGNKPVDVSDDRKKESDKAETIKKSPVKEEEVGSESKSSSSSSSNSSSSSCSSSSSSEEEQKPEARPSVKARELKPIRQPSLFSPQPTPRPTVDLPFLDKVSRPLSSTSASSDSDSTKTPMSGSRSPSPKRMRPRRRINLSSDSPRKAPDKKFKTSERLSESRVSSPIAEREESSRHNDSCISPRVGARSITPSRNLSKSDDMPRRTSKDNASINISPNKSPRQNNKSREFSPEEWKTNKTLNKIDIVGSKLDSEPNSGVSKTCRPTIEEKYKNVDNKTKISPTKHLNVTNRRPSLKVPIDIPRAFGNKERRPSKYEPHCSSDYNKLLSPPIAPTDKPYINERLLATPTHIVTDHDKHWFPKVPSPKMQPPPVEKPVGNEKYMTEDKSLDSDITEKSSVKMIAKIQATLNENTMIKSPKTPMDARTNVLDPMDVDTPLSRNVRINSTRDTDRKFLIHDSSYVQGVEISKSAKIPSTYPNRSLFSPQPKDNEYFEFDMLGVDEGFNQDDITKPFTYGDFNFKEDSKEEGVQETLNLVEKLRMSLGTKISSVQNETLAADDAKEMELDKETSNNEIESEPQDNCTENYVDNKSPDKNVAVNHIPQGITETRLSRESRVDTHVHQNTSKWQNLPPKPLDHSEPKFTSKEYTESVSYSEYPSKDANVHPSENQSTEFEQDAVSKQSDDSQSLSVADHSTHSNDQESLSQENPVIDNNNSLLSDSATISSPYISQESKWRESKITQRRSSASSTNSDGSICSQKTNMQSHVGVNSCDPHPGMMTEMDPYRPMPPQYSMPMDPMSLSQYSHPYVSEPSFMSTITSVPLFPPGPCPSQMPLSSPGPLYAPSLVPFNTPSLNLGLPKPPFSTLCAAAFTTSSQNLALTTAMIAPPTPKPIDSPQEDIDIGSDKYSLHPTPSPTISVDSYNDVHSNRPPMSKASNESNDSMTLPASLTSEPKSSPKTKTSKFMNYSKSPGRSPGISPKQSEYKTSVPKRPSSKSNRSQRGRGRSKSRTHGIHGYPGINGDYLGNSIQSKLVGTVYDFDQEIANDSVDLKALRERRKSIDVHDRKTEATYKEPVVSPVASPVQSHRKVLPPPTEVKDPKPASPPVSYDREKSTTSPSSKTPSEKSQPFQPVVQPVLPGPVDMRSHMHQSFENAAPPAEPYHSHLLAFDSGTADQQLVDIDEEVEKQLHSALKASKPEKSPKSATTPAIEPPTIQRPDPPLPKVSLTDSRNQLKVKIKGPFLDANYSTSSSQLVVPQPPIPVMEPAATVMGTPNTLGTYGMLSGTPNLRRMRKKELLRQYVQQDMNMDDPSLNSGLGPVQPPVAPQPIPRAVIAIPKAVASMTCIPTREDYKCISEPVVEKKKRKTTSGLSRELRHLEVSMNDDVDPSDDIKLSTFSTTPQSSHKRRPRVSSKPVPPATPDRPAPPKLKIKIGSSFVQPPANDDQPLGDQFRPPKKRILAIPLTPSFEDLRRESMKYRRKVMADFEEDEKVRRHRIKSEKRKRKKDKKCEKLRVINDDSVSDKLIIKIKRTKEEKVREPSDVREPIDPAPSVAPVVADPFDYDPTAPDPLAIDPPSATRKVRSAKVTPIRLKLSRSAEGSRYVMEATPEAANQLPVR